MTREDIRMRNWQKARLVGLTFNTSILGQAELGRVTEMLNLRDSLLKDWDFNTTVLIGHSLPPHKCASCGKRSNKQYLLQGVNYCRKHFKIYNGN